MGKSVKTIKKGRNEVARTFSHAQADSHARHTGLGELGNFADYVVGTGPLGTQREWLGGEFGTGRMEKMKRKKRIGIGRYLGRRVNFSSIKEIIIHSRMIVKMS